MVLFSLGVISLLFGIALMLIGVVILLIFDCELAYIIFKVGLIMALTPFVLLLIFGAFAIFVSLLGFTILF